ncbi:MAG: IS1380 family transposase [Saprospiraceae bacterium]|nr:IS1380 family transposase [Saprospiraceae bacterium]
MKVRYSNNINAFGGVNFVLQEFDKLKIGNISYDNLPSLSPKSSYSWRDIFYSFSSIYFCGGNCMEDAKTILANQFGSNPIFNLCSPDTLLRRMGDLCTDQLLCNTKRGNVEHQYNINQTMTDMNIKLLKKLGEFNKDEVVLDYDNTIIFTEKEGCKMTYKRDYGYQPGVGILNEQNVLYIENRNGNSDAKAFQLDTLERMFQHLKDNNISRIDKFRADAASYQYDVVKLVEKNVTSFYIGARNSYVEKYFALIEDWIKTKDQTGEDVYIGEIEYRPFAQQGNRDNKYRLLVKKKLRKDGQLNMFTNESYDYHAIVTNDFSSSLDEAIKCYNRRGACEKQFDILKNDFGWNYLPFSNLSKNTVFLYFSAICRNLYNVVISNLSKVYKNVNIHYRMKRFIFNFIAIPAVWKKASRQWYLRVYGKIPLQV